ncbi:MAG: tetratricopeptide repeat protein, partial [Pseudomonadota bacterium]
MEDTIGQALPSFAMRQPPAKQLKRVRALNKSGKFGHSIALCRKLEAEGYASAEFYHQFGMSLKHGGHLEQAAKKFDIGLKFAPNDVEMLNALGMVLKALGDVDVAVEVLKLATRADEKHYSAWLNLGSCLRELERYEAANLAFTCAHHLEPEKPEPRLNLVYLLMDRRQYAVAETVMDELLASTKHITADLSVKRLRIAAQLLDFDRINRDAPKIERGQLSTNHLAELDTIRAYACEYAGETETAIDILEPWLMRETSHKEHIISYLGLCYSAAGQIDRAIALHTALLEEKPDSITARYNLAFLQFRNGDLGAAFENYEARWEWKEFPSKRRRFDAPQWNGEELMGKRLLLWREQG